MMSLNESVPLSEKYLQEKQWEQFLQFIQISSQKDLKSCNLMCNILFILT